MSLATEMVGLVLLSTTFTNYELRSKNQKFETHDMRVQVASFIVAQYMKISLLCQKNLSD